MTLVGFKDPTIAKRLREFAANLGPLTADNGVEVTTGYLFKTPTGGIPALSGTTLGKATCDSWFLSFDGTDADLTVQTDSGGTTITATVHHMGTVAVGGSVYIVAFRINGLYVAQWEDCG